MTDDADDSAPGDADDADLMEEAGDGGGASAASDPPATEMVRLPLDFALFRDRPVLSPAIAQALAAATKVPPHMTQTLHLANQVAAQFARDRTQLLSQVSALTANPMADFIRLADTIVPKAFAERQRQISAMAAHLVLPQSTLSSYRSLLAAADSVAKLQLSNAFMNKDFLATAGLATRMAKLATASELVGRLDLPSQLPTAELANFLAHMRARPSDGSVLFGARASRGVSSLVAFDVLRAGSAASVEKAVEYVTDELVPAWVNGPQAVRERLIAKLGDVDEGLVPLLKGAWEEVHVPRELSVMNGANAIVELIGRLLRHLGPEDEVLAWHASTGRSPKELNTRPDGTRTVTRALRVRYYLQSQSKERSRLVSSQVEALAQQLGDLSDEANKHKHTRGGTLAEMQSNLVALESILCQLLLV